MNFAAALAAGDEAKADAAVGKTARPSFDRRRRLK